LRIAVAAVGLLSLVLVASTGAAPRTLQPLVVGWEQILRVEWDQSDRQGQERVQGSLVNASPYTITRARVLVESLDERGEILAQRVVWVPGELTPFTRVHFGAAPAQRAPRYRVRVFDFDQFVADVRQAP
jgi:hypothetical protein